MIQIDTGDLPITIAQKLITATKPSKTSLFEEDMFDDEELREIAHHILVYLGEDSRELIMQDINETIDQKLARINKITRKEDKDDD